MVNNLDGDISVIELETNARSGSDIPIGGAPEIPAIAISPDGSRLFATNSDTDELSVINTATRTRAAPDLRFATSPLDVALSPDGSRAWVVLSGGEGANGSVAVVNTATNARARSDIPLGKDPRSVALNRTGRRAYVTNRGDADITVLNTATGAKAGPDLPMGIFSSDFAIKPDGSKGYAVGESSVAAVQTLVYPPPPPGPPTPIPPRPPPTIVSAFFNARVVALTPSGDRAYVNAGTEDEPLGTISVIDTATDAKLPDRITIPEAARGLAVGPDGSRLYATVGNDDDGTPGAVRVIDTDASVPIGGPIPVGAAPTPITVDPSVDLSLAAKRKQKPNRLSLEVSCGDLSCEARITGKATVPTKGGAKGSKKRSFPLEPTAVSLGANSTERVKLVFKGKRSAKRIRKLLKKAKKARKRSKLVARVEATGQAGGTGSGKRKIRLKR